MIKKSLIISLLSLGGMLIAFYVDILLARNIDITNLNDIVLKITLIVAFDTITRESMRFSLLNRIAESIDSDRKNETICCIIKTIMLVGVPFAIIYSILYQNLSNNTNVSECMYSICVIMFLTILFSNIVVICNIVYGNHIFTSIRNYVLPTSMLLLLYLFDIDYFEYGIFLWFFFYAFVGILNLQIVYNKSKVDLGVLKELFFPMVNYGALQSNRYIERSVTSNVGDGHSYSLYFSSRVYAAVITIISMPLSQIMSESLANNKFNKREIIKKLFKVLSIIFVCWTVIFFGYLVILKFEGIKYIIPNYKNIDLDSVLIFYLIASLFGGVSIQLQAVLYRYNEHKKISAVVTMLNILYLIVLTWLQVISLGKVITTISMMFLMYTVLECMILFYIFSRLKD
ncbi:hypothetical protein ACQKP8_08925 [Photobacterium alginatilyticum]|uniref:hypothetical protein n=1 Tax=Photobacterium alginatilyticum TaxID=1775171 RepID=UPI0040689F20